MTNSYLVDTNVLILAIRRRPVAWDLLRSLVTTGISLSCSVITIGEIYSGLRPHEQIRTEKLLAEFEVYPITTEIARYAGLLKNEWRIKGFTLSLADTMIAATAIAHKLILVTDNRRDFPMPGLVLHPDP